MEWKRYNKDTGKYNELAIDAVKRKGGIINDLYTLLCNALEEYHSDQTHYYTKEGTRIITNQVIEFIEKMIDIKAKELDYDALFAQNNDAVGL